MKTYKKAQIKEAKKSRGWFVAALMAAHNEHVAKINRERRRKVIQGILGSEYVI